MISFERGDIDVRTSHTKTLFFSLFRVYHVLDTLFFTKNHDFSPVPQVQPRPKNLAKRKYILNFWKKIVFSFERGDIDVRPSHAKVILFFDFFECITHLTYFFGYHHVWEQWRAYGGGKCCHQCSDSVFIRGRLHVTLFGATLLCIRLTSNAHWTWRHCSNFLVRHISITSGAMK